MAHIDQFSYDLAEHNLSYNSEKNEFYTDSIIGTPVTFSCKITEGKTNFQAGRVVSIVPSYATYYYTLLLNYDYTEFVEVCDDVAFLNKLAVNNKKEFINFTDIQCNSHTLSITIQAKAYAELSDVTFATKLFFQAYENADELVQLIFKESKTKGFY